MLPSDPVMLLSYVNTKLRDEYSSLDDFCRRYSVDKEDIINKLDIINYQYDENINQFK